VEPGAPLLGVELRRAGFLKASLKYRDEALWRLELRQMADPFEDLEAAAGIASCARSPCRTGMIGSRAPQMISTGKPSER
jgi:hypothetical protein